MNIHNQFAERAVASTERKALLMEWKEMKQQLRLARSDELKAPAGSEWASQLEVDIKQSMEEESRLSKRRRDMNK